MRMDLSQIEAWTRMALELEAGRRGIRDPDFRSRAELVRLILRDEYGEAWARGRRRVATGVKGLQQARDFATAAAGMIASNLPGPLDTFLALRSRLSLSRSAVQRPIPPRPPAPKRPSRPPATTAVEVPSPAPAPVPGAVAGDGVGPSGLPSGVASEPPPGLGRALAEVDGERSPSRAPLPSGVTSHPPPDRRSSRPPQPLPAAPPVPAPVVAASGDGARPLPSGVASVPPVAAPAPVVPGRSEADGSVRAAEHAQAPEPAQAAEPAGAPVPLSTTDALGAAAAAAAAVAAGEAASDPHADDSDQAPEAPAPETRSFTEEPIRTHSMARLLARQGHRERALAIYEELLAAHGEDVGLRREMEALRERAGAAQAETLPVPGHRPTPVGDDRISCERDTTGAVRVRWRVTDAGAERARELLGEAGELAVRVVAILPDEARVVRSDITEHGPVAADGTWLASAPQPGARCLVAVGMRDRGARRFVSIAHVRPT